MRVRIRGSQVQYTAEKTQIHCVTEVKDEDANQQPHETPAETTQSCITKEDDLQYLNPSFKIQVC